MFRVLVAMVVALVLQTTLARFVARGNLAVDLVFVAVVCLALSGGPAVGIVAGTVGGVAQDALSSGILGIGGLTKTLVGFLAGVVGTQFIVAQTVPRAFVFFLAGLAHVLILVSLSTALGLRRFDIALSTTAIFAGVNALVGVLVVEVLEFAPGAAERRRMARGGGMRVTPRWRE